MNSPHQFLSGGGEMGKLIRAKDWSLTPLGATDTWPQSLRTMVSVLLDNPFGMYIAWGKEYTQIYNDGYRPILGTSKHPQALGISTRKTFSEIWHIVSPMFDGVMDGVAVGFPDFMLPLDRNGYVEDCYFNFAYSPIRIENGEVGGILLTITETTEKKAVIKALNESKNELEFVIEAAELGTYDYNPITNAFSGNARLKAWFGLPPEDKIDLADAIDAIAEVDKKRVSDAINNALNYASGGTYDIEYSIVNPVTKKETVVQAKGRAWFNDEKVAYRLNGTLEDVTAEVKARQKILENEKNLSLMIMQAPTAIAIFRGENYLIEIINPKGLEIWGKSEKEVLNTSLFDAYPDVVAHGLDKILDEVYSTGIKFSATEMPLIINRQGGAYRAFLSFNFDPLYDAEGSINGIMVTGFEVTEQVLARKKIEESEQRFQAAISAIDGVLWTNSAVGEMVGEQKAWAELTGQTFEEYQGYGWAKAVHPDDSEPTVRAWNKTVSEKKIFIFQHRVLKKDGVYGTFSVHAIPLINNKGEIIEWVGVHTDITSQEQAKEEMQKAFRQIEESEQRFRTLADVMPQFIWTADENGNLNYFNQAVYNYTGLAEKEIEQLGWLEIVHPDDREENANLWMHSVSTGEDFLIEHRFRRSDGEYRWQLSRAVPQKDAAGTIKKWVGTSTDIQEIKEQEQQKDFFISMASHELKTPLTSVKGYVQILMMKYANSEDSILKNSLKTIDKQILNLTRLISELLDISKIKSGGLDLNKEHFELSDLINEVVLEITHINPEYKISLNIEEDIRIYADRNRIGQVLINFLTNAIKYSPEIKVIEIDCYLKDSFVTVSIQDFGIGISKSEQDKIFGRFYRVEGRNEKTFPGFGIGLFISADIINKHQGKIKLESELGKGSVFSFELPIN